MRQIKASILIYLFIIFQDNIIKCNPINGFPPHMMAPHHPGFMHPAMLPLYPALQYPAFPIQHQLASSSNIDEVLQQQSSNTQPASTGTTNNNGKDGTKTDEEDDDVNKRDDEDTFWEAVSSYGKNRWTNFKDGWTELGDIFRAGGRSFKNLFTFGD